MFKESGVVGKIGDFKVYLGGCSGIERPVDIDGNEIKEGDILSWNYGGSSDPKEWMYLPHFKVEMLKSGNGFCGRGIDKEKRFYLHDFEFKNCKKFPAKSADAQEQ